MLNNICGNCMGFVCKDGICKFCGTYYPEFDNQPNNDDPAMNEYAEKQKEVLGEYQDVRLEINGNKICPCKIRGTDKQIELHVPFTIKNRERLDSYLRGCMEDDVRYEIRFIHKEKVCLKFVGEITAITQGPILPDRIAEMVVWITVLTKIEEVKEWQT